jgi:hypothetical protein
MLAGVVDMHQSLERARPCDDVARCGFLLLVDLNLGCTHREYL